MGEGKQVNVSSGKFGGFGLVNSSLDLWAGNGTLVIGEDEASDLSMTGRLDVSGDYSQGAASQFSLGLAKGSNAHLAVNGDVKLDANAALNLTTPASFQEQLTTMFKGGNNVTIPVITFTGQLLDDGSDAPFSNNLQYSLPVFEKYNVSKAKKADGSFVDEQTEVPLVHTLVIAGVISVRFSLPSLRFDPVSTTNNIIIVLTLLPGHPAFATAAMMTAPSSSAWAALRTDISLRTGISPPDVQLNPDGTFTKDNADGGVTLSIKIFVLPKDVARVQKAALEVADVDCEIGPFADAGTCSRLCGGGKQSRQAPIVRSAQNGGAPCPTRRVEVSCNTQPCPLELLVNYTLPMTVAEFDSGQKDAFIGAVASSSGVNKTLVAIMRVTATLLSRRRRRILLATNGIVVEIKLTTFSNADRDALSARMQSIEYTAALKVAATTAGVISSGQTLGVGAVTTVKQQSADCVLTAWGVKSSEICDNECGGTFFRTREVATAAVGDGADCSSPLSSDRLQAIMCVGKYSSSCNKTDVCVPSRTKSCEKESVSILVTTVVLLLVTVGLVVLGWYLDKRQGVFSASMTPTPPWRESFLVVWRTAFIIRLRATHDFVIPWVQLPLISFSRHGRPERMLILMVSTASGASVGGPGRSTTIG